MRYLLAALAFLFSIASDAAEPQGTIRGRVSDKVTHEPLAGVYVLYGRNMGVSTAGDGTYIIETAAGRISITFQYVGYQSVTKEITISGGEEVQLDVELSASIREIDQVVISANRTEQRISDLSVSMDIIRNSFLVENHITDAREIIDKTPGIEVMDGQASVRGGSGFSYGAGSRVLALIDGLPMLAADAGNIKWQFLPLENLSQIEIIKGASSVLYGSAALNGVINFRTADASNTPLTQFYTEAGFYGEPQNKDWVWWKSSRVFTSTSLSHLQKIGKNDIGFSANLMADQGYRRLNEENLGRVSLKLKHFNGKVEGLNYGISLHSGATIKRDFVLWENATNGALRQQETATIQLHGKFLAADPFISLKRNDRWRHDLRMRFQTSLNRFPESAKTNSDAWSLFTEYQMGWKPSRIIDFTAGISENYNIIVSNMYDDHKGINLAAFTQMEIRPFSTLKGVAGVRLENNSLDGISDKLVPVVRAGLNWQAAEYTFLRASFGQGYRFPSIAEKHASTTLGSVVIFPNPDALPESGWSTEAGIKQGVQLGKVTGQADLSVFMSQNTNMIEYFLAVYNDPETGLPSTGFKATNIEQSRVYGAELEMLLNGSFGRVNATFNGGYTFIYPVEFSPATNRNTGEYLKYRRKHSGKLTANFSWKKLRSEFSFYARSKILRIDSFFLNETTGEQILPGFPDYWARHNTGYIVMDGNLGYDLNGIITLSVAVKNLTNTEYMGRPGDVQPQRNYSLRISAKF